MNKPTKNELRAYRFMANLCHRDCISSDGCWQGRFPDICPIGVTNCTEVTLEHWQKFIQARGVEDDYNNDPSLSERARWCRMRGENQTLRCWSPNQCPVSYKEEFCCGDTTSDDWRDYFRRLEAAE